MSEDIITRLRRVVTWQDVVPHDNELAREAADEIERWRIICEEQAAKIARSAEKFRHLKTIIESDD